MATSTIKPVNGNYYMQTYDVSIFSDIIHTTVTTDGFTASNWIEKVTFNNSDLPIIVGLHVEYCSPPENPAAATLHLCTGNRCLIYQISHSTFIPLTLASFLTNENITFVGVGLSEGLQRLRKGYWIGGTSTPPVELREAAASLYGHEACKSAEIEKLASLVLGVEMAEKPRHNRWNAWRLKAEQVQHACVDAYLSIKIGEALDACNYTSN